MTMTLSDVQAGPPGGLKRRRGGIRHHRQVFEGDVAAVFYFTQVDAGNRDVAGKSAVDADAVARHFLMQTTVSPAGFAQMAPPAGHHRRYQDFLADPRPLPGHHRAGDFVSQDQRRRGYRRHTVVKITQIRVADAASGDLHQHFVRFQHRRGDFGFFQNAGRYRTALPVPGSRPRHLPGCNCFR